MCTWLFRLGNFVGNYDIIDNTHYVVFSCCVRHADTALFPSLLYLFTQWRPSGALGLLVALW